MIDPRRLPTGQPEAPPHPALARTPRMIRLPVPLVGNDTDGWRVDLPTFVMVGEPDYENAVVLVDVPDYSLPPELLERAAQSDPTAPVGALGGLSAGEVGALHAHLDALYPEAIELRGEPFRPAVLDYHTTKRHVDEAAQRAQAARDKQQRALQEAAAAEVPADAPQRAPAAVGPSGGSGAMLAPPTIAAADPGATVGYRWVLPAIGGALALGFLAGQLSTVLAAIR